MTSVVPSIWELRGSSTTFGLTVRDWKRLRIPCGHFELTVRFQAHRNWWNRVRAYLTDFPCVHRMG